MNTVERYRAAFLGEPVDRVPICAWLGMQFVSRLMGKEERAILEEEVSDPSAIINLQEELGLDPIVVTMDDRWFSQHLYWRLLYSWPEQALDTWRVTEKVVARTGEFITYRYTAETPEGPIEWSYEAGGGRFVQLESPIKQESDLDRMMHSLPEPESINQDKLAELVKKVGDRAFMVHNVLSPWGEAVNMRGFENISMDLYDRPEFVKRLCEFLKQRALGRVRYVAKTGVHSIVYDHSWLGTGYSPAIYREFMLPHDREIVQAAREVGLLVSFHDCGRGMAILDDIVSTRPHALETLTPKTSSGDFDLAEVKRRVGKQVTLNGGFDERVLASGAPESVREAVKRCLDVAADGHRYILRTCGQIFDAAPGNIETFTQAARDYGRC